ncbi:AAA family ATPase [Duganella sp. CY15W]|nr:AAA family ATPase [Duganella sp. CY15W]
MPVHLKKFAFCGLRRLNTCRDFSVVDSFQALLRSPHFHYRCDQINLLLGANGGGKSTVLHMIDLLRDPARICTLPRENQPADSHSAYSLEFSNRVQLLGLSRPLADPDSLPAQHKRDDVFDWQHLWLRAYELDKNDKAVTKLTPFGGPVNKRTLAVTTRDGLAAHYAQSGAHVVWFTPAQWTTAEAAAVLHMERASLLGLADGETKHEDDPYFETSKDFDIATAYVDEQDRLHLLLEDDTFQHSRVDTAALPMGWQQLVAVLHWLKQQEGAICLLEEPDTHMHPHLQRLLARRMGEIAKDNKLQLFVSTHSPVMQDTRTWGPLVDKVKTFEAAGGILDNVVHPQRLLDLLGIRGSDIGQCNGVIWVEGPSDRFYIRHWLTLWARAGKIPTFIEHVDYSFMFYGGAVLAHFSTQDEEDFVKMLRLNRKAFIVMDRDDDFAEDEQGNWQALNTASAKLRVANSLGGLRRLDAPFWITPGPTIESSLPVEAMRRRAPAGRGGLGRAAGVKVRRALAYCDDYQSHDQCSAHQEKIDRFVHQLAGHINTWCK